jgi:copper(I)-binding protein
MKRIAIAALLFAALPAIAQVTVTDPWVRGTVGQQKATGAFMQLKAEQDSRLVAVKSAVAGIVEIHEMAMEKDIMKMRALPNGLELPAGKSVELKPGGYHIMLIELKQQMREGNAVPLTLVIEGKDKKQTQVEVKATVKPLATPSKMESMHKH